MLWNSGRSSLSCIIYSIKELDALLCECFRDFLNACRPIETGRFKKTISLQQHVLCGVGTYLGSSAGKCDRCPTRILLPRHRIHPCSHSSLGRSRRIHQIVSGWLSSLEDQSIDIINQRIDGQMYFDRRWQRRAKECTSKMSNHREDNLCKEGIGWVCFQLLLI